MFWWRRRSQADFKAEIESHLELQTEELTARGMSPSEARAAARRAFGNVTHAAERFYDSRRWAWVERIARDVQYAARVLRRNSEFTALAVLTIGFGIGVNTSIFSMLYAFMLRPLPVPQAERVVDVWRGFRGNPVRLEVRFNSWALSYPEYVDLRDHTSTLAGLAVVYDDSASFGLSEPAATSVQFVSCNYFQTLGIRMAHGTAFRPEQCTHLGGAPVIVLGDGFWRRAFGSVPSIIGRPITVNQLRLTVIGIAPPGFDGVSTSSARAWIPITMHPTLTHGRDSVIVREASWLSAIGRLAPGVTTQQATADLQHIIAQRDRLIPQRHSVISVARASLAPGPKPDGSDALLIFALVGGATIITIMTCANVMNLLLARGVSRRREMGARLAIGASRGRLIAQLMTESGLLALGGAVVGVGIAYWLPSAIVNGLKGMPRIERVDVSPDGHVLAYAIVLALVAAMAVGLLPSLEATRLDLASALRNEPTLLSRHRGNAARARAAIVGVQVATSALLLIVVGLFIRGVRAVETSDPGFEMQHLVAVRMDLGREGYTAERSAALHRSLRERIAAIPGVEAVSAARFVPLVVNNSSTMSPADKDAGGVKWENVRLNDVEPGYFPTIGVPLLRGRAAAPAEVPATGPRPAVISARMASRFWPGQDPIGKELRADTWRWIVTGVARDVRNVSLANNDQAFVYEAARADPTGLQLLVRTTVPPAEVARAIGPIVHELDRSIVVIAEPYDAVVGRVLHTARASTFIATVMVVLAAVVAMIGVYGVVNFNVRQRTPELGLRMALGATRWSIMVLVVRSGLTLVVGGVVVGTLLAVGVGTALRGLLYGVSPIDPQAFVGMTAALLLAAVAAMCGPAARATRVDPAESLRIE